MPTPEELDKKAQEHIAGLVLNVRQLWGQMCREAGIPEDSSFVDIDAFKGSRYLPVYDRALNELQEVRRQRTAGEYVGLRIEGGRAVWPK